MTKQILKYYIWANMPKSVAKEMKSLKKSQTRIINCCRTSTTNTKSDKVFDAQFSIALHLICRLMKAVTVTGGMFLGLMAKVHLAGGLLLSEHEKC